MRCPLVSDQVILKGFFAKTGSKKIVRKKQPRPARIVLKI